MPDDRPFPGVPSLVPLRPRGPATKPQRPRPRRLVDDRQSGLPAIPIPIPVGIGSPFPFPTGPAANDPFFRPPIGIGGIILAGGIGIIIGATGELIRRRVEKLQKERAQREAEAEEEGRIRRRERIEREIPAKTMPRPDIFPEIPLGIPSPRPEIPTAPGRLPRPEFPEVPISIPQFPQPIPVPGPASVPGPVTLPEPSVPTPAPLPKPGIDPGTIPGFGVPQTLPGTFPSPFPSPFPGVSPFPTSFPVPKPVRFPTNRPIGDPLTGFRPVGVGSLPRGFADVGPQPDPSAQPQQERCREVKNRRRQKNECFEGFYAEFPLKTQFKTWRKVNCTTRQEIK